MTPENIDTLGEVTRELFNMVGLIVVTVFQFLIYRLSKKTEHNTNHMSKVLMEKTRIIGEAKGRDDEKADEAARQLKDQS